MLTVLNDTHIGAVRSGGTTLNSQWELRQHLLRKFRGLLPVRTDLMILGDLFDTVNVAIRDVLETYLILKDWCYANPENALYLVAGNHDISKTSNVLSSFDFLCKLLESSGVSAVCIKAPAMTPHGYVIPHLPNQVLFDEALLAMPTCEVCYLHCNYDNNFAAQSDQSLNLSREQAEALPAARIVLGHEHKSRRSAKVVIPGNQIASSVSDWIDQPNKMFVQVDAGVVSVLPIVEPVEFIELDWQALEVTDHKFIRVTGTAATEQAAAVVTAISKFRQTSQAYVVTNAVRIASADDDTVFEDALEGVAAFDVMTALREIFTLEEMTLLEGLPNA